MPKGGGGAALEDDFENADAGAAEMVPKQCSALRKNEMCMIKGKPCKIVEMSTSKTGKHGHAKVHLVGIGVIDGKKYEDICPSTHNMNVPVVQNTQYQLVDVSDENYLSLMDDSGELHDHMKLPDGDVGKEILKMHGDGTEGMVSVIKVCGEEKITGVKPINTSK